MDKELLHLAIEKTYREGQYSMAIAMDTELLQLAADLRAGFHAALSYVVHPDENDDWAELTEDDISERISKAHRAADRLTQIERERAGQMRVDSE